MISVFLLFNNGKLQQSYMLTTILSHTHLPLWVYMDIYHLSHSYIKLIKLMCTYPYSILGCLVSTEERIIEANKTAHIQFLGKLLVNFNIISYEMVIKVDKLRIVKINKKEGALYNRGFIHLST